MNYLMIVFSDDNVSIERNAEKYTYQFNRTNSTYQEWLNLAKEIKSQSKDIEGGVLHILSPKYYEDTGIIITSDDKPINLPIFFTEIFNKPFISHCAKEIDIIELEKKLNKAQHELTWSIEYAGLTVGKDEYCQESLLTVANGYIGLRGTLPEMTISDDYYPATYIAGLYNQVASEIESHQVINEDFVNAPNGQFISLKIGEGEYLNPNTLITHHLTRHLDLKTGVMSSHWIVETSEGKKIKITT